MLTLIDVGNTAITYGIYDSGRFLKHGSLLKGDIPSFARLIANSGAKSSSHEIIISSVVPFITHKLAKSISIIKGAKIYILGRNLKVKINHKYINYNSLGIDRVVNIYGALRIYKAPFLIFDFGTAITCDYVSSKGIFEGGLIIPGPEISFQALCSRAALLPKKLRLPKKADGVLGRDTKSCMISGILEGYGAMTNGLISRYKSLYGNKLKIILTGGFSGHLCPYLTHACVLDPKHSIKSLLIIAKDCLPH